MGKLFKILGGLVLVLLLLIVAAVIILPMVIDPNDYKDEIVTQVKGQTGRDLTIAGDLKLSVFPWLGIEIGGLELSNAPGFGEQPFAVVKSAAIRVKLMPLLSRRLEVDTVGLDGLALNLAKSKEGVSNWDDLIKEGAPAEGAPAEGKPAAGAGRGLEGFMIGGVDISDARIRWDDQSAGQQYTVDRFFLKSGAIRPGSPVSLELGAQLQSREPELNAEIKLEGEVTLDEAARMLHIKGLELQVDATSPLFQKETMSASLVADVGVALDGQSLAVDGLSITADELKLTGNLQGSNLAAQPAFSGTLNLAELNLREWLGGQGMVVPETADPQVLTRFGAAIELASQDDVTRLNKLAIVLDDSKINGNASLQGGAIGFDLDVDSIDLDRYLPPVREETAAPAPAAPATPTAGSTGTAPAATQAGGDEPLLPVELLRGLNLNGTLKIGQMIIRKLTAREIQVTVKASQGKIDVQQKIGAFYQGSLDGLVNLNVAGKTPVVQIAEQATNIQAGPLLQDLIAKDKFDGRGSFQTKLRTSGNSINAFKRALNGDLSFRFEDGAVKGVNLAQLLREGQAKLKGEKLPADSAPPQTDFSELGGTAVIKQGVLDNQDLLAKSPFLRVTGAGQVNLVTETLDYLIKPVIVSTAAGQGGAGLEQLKGVPIPVKLTGPYASPDYTIDWAQVVTASQKAKLEEKEAELKQRLEEKKQETREKLEDKLKDRLKGLFN
ncbi:AsmA family protein [Sedimenticola hydrogenitrophicus]|uniref:AsmA family protein n=1 Tax=Sedimenticola hydrogenitrophicus TaxID=2967975 RepID=UPI0023AF145D|nr:AsmA family protein [Sedimenticola hydrogenitrophicus]